jgi:alkanesulfonate monooxygenase SsuD/methylene tetrahydromethanopterin reductase-like flavin-dependent oxidoreductase (luciferase family)
MKFGLLLTSTDAASGPRQLERHIKMVKAAEEAGFSTIVASQHFLSLPYAYFHPIVLLSRLSVETSLRLATGVLLMPLLQPVEVAEAMATLDVMSGGRAVCGVGIGYRPDEFAAFGRSLSERGARADEALEIMAAMWASAGTGETIDYQGRYYNLAGLRCTLKPVQEPRVPLWVGGDAEPVIRRAARLGDAWYAPPGVPVSELRRKAELYRTLLGQFGRPAPERLPVRREVLVMPDRAAARERAAEVISARYKVYNQWRENTEAHSDLRPDVLEGQSALRGGTVDEPAFVERTVVGDAKDAIDQLRRVEESAGMPVEVVMRLQWPGMDDREILDMIRYLGSEVVPALAERHVQHQ